MALAAKRIYSGNTAGGGLTVTEVFFNSNMIFVVPKNLPAGEGYEVAAALVVKLDFPVFENTPIVNSYGEREIPLEVNFIDTSAVLLVPDEAVKQGLKCQLILATNYAINVDIYAVEYSQPTNTEIVNKIDELKRLLEQLRASQQQEQLNSLIGTLINALPLLFGLPGLPSLPGGGLPALPPGLGLLPGG